MAYLALYRKYRPRTFDEIVGQTAVVTTLRNQVRFGQLGHAYLFCGTRGTGKTSAAKVFARAVNCLHPVNGSPCNECEMCRESLDEFNVIEIDAASNNSVDNIRDLRDEVQYTPAKGKYKVYIIDEVHMLSTSAFNALLKTLEEPPEHVIFVLATTDPQKVLPTIISRCQRYDFRRLTVEELQSHLAEVCQAEGIQADDEALRYIAMMSDGGCRDSLSILDQCHAYHINEKLTLPMARDVLGAVDTSVFEEMTEALAADDVAGLLTGVQKAYDAGRDLTQFVISWNAYLRDLLVAKVSGNAAEHILAMEAEPLAALKARAKLLEASRIGGWVEKLARLETQMRTATQKRALLEVGLIRLVNETDEQSNASDYGKAQVAGGGGKPASDGEMRRMERRVERLEEGLTRLRSQGISGTASDSQAGGAGERGTSENANRGDGKDDAAESRAVPTNSTAVRAGSEGGGTGRYTVSDEDSDRAVQAWASIRERLIDVNPSWSALRKVDIGPGPEPGVLAVSAEKDIFAEQVLAEPRLSAIQNALADETGKRFRLIQDKKSQKKIDPEEIKKKINW